MYPEATIFLVDDDPAIRDSLALFLGLKGFRIQPFVSAEDFLATHAEHESDPQPGCLLLDIRMAGMDGLSLQQELSLRGPHLPVIVMTAYGDVATTRAALKAGAVDFLEKPIDPDSLLKAVEEAVAKDFRQRESAAEREALQTRIAQLTAREKEVLERVVAGRHNREIAEELAISPRTVEVYKSRIMEKCQVRRFPDLVRLVLRSEGLP
ncbi:MAG: response regulator transcription factor [Gammaproteobacteria bacterium]|nr:response regulator transcription factor [Gammaproteobacteria bacterium]